MMVRVSHILLTSLTIVVCLQPVLSAGQRPNIVFLLADDMNRDTWGVYGNKDCKTPNIDRLAKEGHDLQQGLLLGGHVCPVSAGALQRQKPVEKRALWPTTPNQRRTPKASPITSNPLGYRVALTGKSHVGPQQALSF